MSSPPREDDAPQSKRRRTALACDSCRARKTRCDGARPACNVCVAMDFDCLYHRPVRHSGTGASRGASHEKDISRLESRLQAMERRLQVLADPRTGQYRHSMGSNESPSGGDATSLASGGLHDMPADTTEDTVDGMGVITFADESEAGYFGPTSNSAFFSHIITGAVQTEPGLGSRDIHAPWAPPGAALNYISRPASPPTLSPDQQRPQPRAEIGEDLIALPPHATVVELVNLFFSEIGMLFPYVYKTWIFDGLAKMRPPHRDGIRSSWLCLLNTMMAFATCLAQESDISGQDNVAKADVFLRRALKLIPNTAVKQANLETFQALLLMTQYLQGTQRSAQTWNLHRLAVQVAFQIGVHSPSRSAKCSPLEQEIRKRAWYMCFILDKTCSMTFGRPPTIPNRYVLFEMPLNVELETLDQSNDQIPLTPSPPQAHSTVVLYIQSIKLYQLVGEIIDDVYQNNIECNTTIPSSELFERIIPIERKLSAWKSQLPPDLQVRSRDEILQDAKESPLFSRLCTVITLRYLNTRMLLHRPMISRFLLDHDRTKQGDLDEWNLLLKFGRSSLEVSMLAAVETIDLIHEVSEAQHRMLTTWWFTIYYIFSSALVIFSVMIVERNHDVPSPHGVDLGGSLLKALKSLETIGNGKRMAHRCQKYLTKLMQIATSLGYSNTSESLLNAENPARLGMVMADSHMSKLSPLDLGGYDWDGAFPILVHDSLETASYDWPTTAIYDSL